MNIDDLLSPYRGFRPAVTETVAEEPDYFATEPAPRTRVLRATRIDRGPALASPESWDMYEFVQALTA